MYQVSTETLKQIKLIEQPGIDSGIALLEINGESTVIDRNRLTRWAGMLESESVFMAINEDKSLSLTSGDSFFKLYSLANDFNRHAEPIRFDVAGDIATLSQPVDLEAVKTERKAIALERKTARLNKEISKITWQARSIKEHIEHLETERDEALNITKRAILTKEIKRAVKDREAARIKRAVQACIDENVMELSNFYWIGENPAFKQRFDEFMNTTVKEASYTPRKEYSKAGSVTRTRLAKIKADVRRKLCTVAYQLTCGFLAREFDFNRHGARFQDYRKAIRKAPKQLRDLRDQLESIELELKAKIKQLENLTN